MQRYLTALIILGSCALFGGSAEACSVPVFRYAMERWAPDYYEAVLIHRGQIAENDPAVLLLQGQTGEFLNLHLSKIDIASPAEAQEQVKSLLGGEIPETLPALALWYPWQKGRAAPFWTGAFTPATASALVQSPKRKELADRLSKGQSAVWVLVESGNAAKDKAALQLLSQELETAARELKETLPSLVDESSTGPLAGERFGPELTAEGMPGLSFEFSTLAVSRSDPNESFLRAMLLSSEPDLSQYTDEPILFPVFGRGRALYALVGDGINAENIRETVAFLTGPCGCEVKMLNPGVDLLMAVNWDAAVMQFYQEFYETQETQMELTSAFPQVPAEANTIVDRRLPIADFKSEIVNRKSKIHWFGVVGTTAVSLAAILAVAALGTFAVIRRKHS